MASQSRSIILEANASVGPGANWQSSGVYTGDAGEVLVSVCTEDTGNVEVYVAQYASVGGLANFTQLSLTNVPFPAPSYEQHYVASGTVQLTADNFQVLVFNTDASITASFGVSVRILTRSA